MQTTLILMSLSRSRRLQFICFRFLVLATHTHTHARCVSFFVAASGLVFVRGKQAVAVVATPARLKHVSAFGKLAAAEAQFSERIREINLCDSLAIFMFNCVI